MIPGQFIIGIDPGLTGAIAILPRVRPPEPVVLDMPVIAHSKGGFVKNAVDVAALAESLRPYSVVATCVAYIERVHAFPDQGTGSMFSLGMSFWGVAGVFAGLGIPFHLVEPKEWKGYYRLKKDKELSRTTAQRFYPGVDLSRKKDHNRAEALLIAGYGMAQVTHGPPSLGLR